MGNVLEDSWNIILTRLMRCCCLNVLTIEDCRIGNENGETDTTPEWTREATGTAMVKKMVALPKSEQRAEAGPPVVFLEVLAV